MSIQYRPEIDGLRAISVLIVVFYHAFPTLLPGGMIGVDVFFVISGFLITSILLSGPTFNIDRAIDFYSRRARRLFPALILVLFSCYAFAWVALYPDQMKELGWHIGASSVFLSNFAYLSEAGYFDQASELKPLLHLWSLAVEEQFYLFWPFLMLALLSKNRWKSCLPLLIAVSFTTGAVLTFQNADLAYYSPFSRFWELWAGAMLAFLTKQDGQNKQFLILGMNKRYRQRFLDIAASVSLLFLLIAPFFIRSEHGFPGWQALPVVFFAVVLVYTSQFSQPIQGLLSRPLLVYVGKLSYSFYLWHWPVLAFLAITEPSVQPTVKILAIGFAFLLASLTFHAIEKPIARQGNGTSLALTLGLFLVGFIGLNAHHRNGLEFRDVNYQVYKSRVLASFGLEGLQAYSVESVPDEADLNVFLANNPLYPDQLQRVAALLKEDPTALSRMAENHKLSYRPTRKCESYTRDCASGFGLRKVLILGDSYSADVYAALKHAYPNIQFKGFFGPGCTPISIRYKEPNNRCAQLLSQAKSEMHQHKFDLLILAAKWPAHFTPLLDDIAVYSGLVPKIAVFGPGPTFSTDVSHVLMQSSPGAQLLLKLKNVQNSEPFITNDGMKKLCEMENVAYFDRLKPFCENGFCKVTITGGELLIYDSGHLSPHGAKYLGEQIRQSGWLEQLLQLPTKDLSPRV